VQRFDVCNGDADGLCAVVQWRLHDPSPATLVTGLKRDIALLDRVQASAGDEVLVCDVAMQRNAQALRRLLELGARVRYFDHHAQGEVPQHPLLEAHLDLGAEVCSSVLMDRYLQGEHRAWAAVGAYGDNLAPVADRLCDDLKLGAEQRAWLLAGLAGSTADWNFVAQSVRFAQQDSSPDAGRHIAPRRLDAHASVLLLPDAAWSRRVIGVVANELANANPQRAHAVLKPRDVHGWVVSVRAPLAAPQGADALCQRFGGAGRAAAAGIDHLPAADVDRFIEEFAAASWG